MKLSLYDITQDLRIFEEALIENGGEISDEMEEEYHELLDALEDKGQGYVALLGEWAAAEEGIAKERKRLQDAERRLKSAQKSLKDRLAWAMQVRGKTEIQTPLGKIKWYAGRESVQLDVDDADVPDDFVRITRSVDKTKLKEAMAEGNETALAIAHMERAPYVSIK